MNNIIKSIQKELKSCTQEIKATVDDYYQFGRNVEFQYKLNYLERWHQMLINKRGLIGTAVKACEYNPILHSENKSMLKVTNKEYKLFCIDYLEANINRIKHRLMTHSISFTSNPFANAKEVIERNADMDLLRFLQELQEKTPV